MAGNLRFKVSDPSEAWVKAMRDKYKPIARAATKAMNQVADNIKAQGRANIMAAGFSKKWANAFRVNVYPKGRVSADAAALVYHKIPYADVFETGAMIRGSPFLWLPLPDAPKGRGNRRIPAGEYRKEIGHPLYSIKRPSGKPPLLGAVIRATKARFQKGISRAQLKRGRNPHGKGVERLVPLYIGIPAVEIGQKFRLRSITAANASKLAAYYYRNFLDE
ncbi:MAG: hypothetical protein EOQ52_20385 [Mesorhizobium sp.]|uniref:DUF6441 family protein n=1 Tax=Mesorhizobium sp. TaxID=1871066 RepID=UPI000FE8DF75|nr:DUF6441 family protein [Mesorhizobium sp.]RWB85912.1 MAG: hypothetical protein EOQ52_20385 [Mesorhizobium sp.]